MRIACPTCQAAYEVPDTLLRPPAPGAAARKVKCARCGNAWTPAAPEAVPAPVALPAPLPSRGPQAALPAPDAPPVPAPASVPAPAPVPVVVPVADALPPAEPDDLPPPPVVAPPQAAPVATPVATSMAPSGPAPVPRVAEKLTPAEPPSEAARGPGLVLAILAWVASLAVLGGAVWAALRWREAVTAAWGPARRAYEWLGLM